MKLIPLPTLGPLSAKGQLLGAVHSVPADGLTIGAMRVRLKLADKIAAAEGESVILEDPEHDALCAAINCTRWLVVDKDLLAICEGALNAKEPPAAAEPKPPQAEAA